MSGLFGAGGFFSRIVEGIQTAFGQLAKHFRLGQYASYEGTEPPDLYRPRLETPEEMVAELARRRLAPPARTVERLNSSSASTRFERSKASNCRTTSFWPHSFNAV